VLKSLSASGRLVTSPKLTYLEQRSKLAAKRLRGWGDETSFGVVSMLPTSILVAGFLIRVGHVHVLTSVVLSAVLFFLGMWWTTMALFMWQLDIDTTILLYKQQSTNSAVQPPAA